MKGERELLNIRMREVDGSRRWIEGHGLAGGDARRELFDGGRPRHHDTSTNNQVELQRSHEQQKRVEAELRESQELTRRVLEAVPAGILMVFAGRLHRRGEWPCHAEPGTDLRPARTH